MNWNEYKSEFAWDGSWRDIYILNTDIQEWQTFVDFLRSSKYDYEFNGELGVLPEDLSIIFNSDQIPPTLTIKTDGVTLKCHFFTTHEIEFDLDPREVTNESKAKGIFKFMEDLGAALKLPVRMTPENLRTSPIFEYSPNTGTVTYFPCEDNT